jgi:glyoxalase family protein
MIHTLRWRVASKDALEFWAERLAAESIESRRTEKDKVLRFEDPEGLALELAIDESGDEPLRAAAEGIPEEHALLGFEGVRAYADDAAKEEPLFTSELDFALTGPGSYRLEGGRRHASYVQEEAPRAAGIQGAGTVHHIAWCDRDDEHAQWRDHLAEAGEHPTRIIDRQYFLSIYFREPRGVLFELATPSPGFAVDEDPEHLGESLRLPPQHEHLREQLERVLTPLENPRAQAPRA